MRRALRGSEKGSAKLGNMPVLWTWTPGNALSCNSLKTVVEILKKNVIHQVAQLGSMRLGEKSNTCKKNRKIITLL